MIGPPVALLHLDCFRYFRRFYPQARLQLKDILKFWPRTLNPSTLSPKHKNTKEKQSFSYCFSEWISLLQPHIQVADSDEEDVTRFKCLLISLTGLPKELLSNIAYLSWPCALQQPLVIKAETTVAERYLESCGKNPGSNLSCFEFTEGEVSFEYLLLSGTYYIAKLCLMSQEVRRRSAPRRITITRDEVGIIDIDFRGDFKPQTLGRGYWYKTLQPEAQDTRLHILSQVQLLCSLTSIADDASTLSQISAWCAMVVRPIGMFSGIILFQHHPSYPPGTLLRRANFPRNI